MDSHPDLYADGSETSAIVVPKQKEMPKGVARVQMPNRSQLELRPSDLESFGLRLYPICEWQCNQVVTGKFL